MSSLFAFWKRAPWIGALAAIGAVAIVVGIAWSTAGVYLPVVTGEMRSITDFSYYYDAAGRFLDGDALYPDANGYMYPPLSVLGFVPLRAFPQTIAFFASVALMAGLVVACVEAVLRLYEDGQGERLERPLRVSLHLIGFATAPVFMNLKYGQVNVFVLAFGLAFLVLLHRDRPFGAALALSAGFWLKLYPLALVLLGLRRGWVGRGALGLLVGLVAVPLALLPVVPAELYRQYFFELVPFWSSVTNTHALNQSLPGVLENLRLPAELYLLSHTTAVHASTKLATLGAMLVLFGGLYAGYFLGRLRLDVVGVGVLAVLPVISGLGWEHTYVLTLPLALYALLYARRRSPGTQALAAFVVFAYFVPKPPQSVMPSLAAMLPRPLLDVLYARFLLATLVLLLVLVAWAWRRETTRAPAAEAAGAREAGAGG